MQLSCCRMRCYWLTRQKSSREWPSEITLECHTIPNGINNVVDEPDVVSLVGGSRECRRRAAREAVGATPGDGARTGGVLLDADDELASTSRSSRRVGDSPVARNRNRSDIGGSRVRGDRGAIG